MKFSLIIILSLSLWLQGCSTGWKKTSSTPSPFLISAGAEWDHPYSGTAVELASGEILVAFEKWTQDKKLPFESHVWLTHVKENKVVGSTKKIESAHGAYTYHPQFAKGPKGTFLYFNVYDPKTSAAHFERAQLEGENLKNYQLLKLNENLKNQYRPWIYPFIARDGQMILTYEWRDPVLERQRRKLSISKDGVHFADSLDFGIGVMGRTSDFADGTLLYTFQNGDPEQTMDYFKISKNARQWTFDRPLSAQKDVHDAIPFQRLDGGIDLYYIAAGAGDRYSLFRRSVNAQGALGPEQELTRKSEGSFMAPHPVRLKDGRVFVVLTKEVKNQTNYDLFGFYVNGDGVN